MIQMQSSLDAADNTLVHAAFSVLKFLVAPIGK